MDLRQGGVMVRASPVSGTPSTDDLLAGLLARDAGRCPTRPLASEISRFQDAGLPTLTALLRCGPGSTGRGGTVAALKLIRSRQAQFIVLRMWEVEAGGSSATVPMSDAMRADAEAVLGSAHVCGRAAPCR